MRFIKFISEFLKHPKQVGAVAESSPFLAKKMAQQIGGATNVVEFGSGTGSVTTEILRNLPENGRLTCFEINSHFCRHLKMIKDSRLRVINDDVQNCDQYVNQFDCILSCLPLGIFDKSKREQILALSSRSKTYIQFQYTPFLRAKLRRYFRDIEVKFVPLNFPPAFVYISKNPRHKALRHEGYSRRKTARAFLSRRIMQTILKSSLICAGFWTLLSRMWKT
jgi:phosphatidylethanolamine/phosphatidyl-N-methylethanolamine N-methyltransferase